MGGRAAAQPRYDEALKRDGRLWRPQPGAESLSGVGRECSGA